MPACVVCDEVITQPLCALCLEEEIATWLLEKLPEQPQLLLRLEELTDEIVPLGGDTRCIKCGSSMSLCGHCYTEYIHAWVAERFPSLVQEFQAFFSTYPMEEEVPQNEMLYA